MKAILRILRFTVFPVVMLAACSKPTDEAPAGKAVLGATISVPEMHCSSCVGTIRGGLRAVPGVEDSTFDLATRQVTVRWDSKKTDQTAIEAAITKAGFKVEQPAAPKP